MTAQGRSQPLADVPLAISAVGAEALANSGASDLRQLSQLTPSLLVSSSSTEAGGGVARIRGIGTVGDNAGLESSVAIFVDGVYRSRTGTSLTELGAIDRIEVLRGPQGTLFGRNASAGLIHVVTAKPSFEEGGTAEFSYGNYDYWRGQIGLTGPITPTIAYRLDGVIMKRDGFARDLISGRDVNDRDRWLLRGQLLFEPGDDLSLRLIADYADRDEECCLGSSLPSGDGSRTILSIMNALGTVRDENTFNRNGSITPGRSFRSDVRDWGISAQLDYDLGGATLTSITAWRDWKWVRGQDADFNNLDLLVRDDNGDAGQRFQTFSQELRLQGEAFGGALDWLVGGYFAQEKLTLKDNLGYGAQYGRYASCQVSNSIGSALGVRFDPASPGCLNPALRAAIGSGQSPLGTLGPVALASLDRLASLANMTSRDTYVQKSRNYALFTHNVINFTDRLSLTLGLRYTNERKTLTADLNGNPASAAVCSGNAAALAPIRDNPALPASVRQQAGSLISLSCVVPPIVSVDLSDVKREDEWTGTAVLGFKPIDDLLTYASFSRGYKAGGYNLDRQGNINSASPTLATLQFAPETVHSWEIGAKFSGRAFDLNLAAFYSVFDNFQLNTFNGSNFIVENVGGCSDDLNGADGDTIAASGACTGKTRGGVVSKGVEVEAFLRPARFLSVNFGATVADTRYRHDLVGADGRPLPTPLFQLPGERLSNAPQYTVTGAASWTPPLTDSLSALVYADFRYQSDFITGSDLDQEKAQPGVVVVNARLGLRGPEDGWSLELWAQNLFDVNYRQVGFDMPTQGSGTRGGVQRGFYPAASQLYGAFLAEPRTYGVTVRTRF